MTSESQNRLNQRTITALQELIEINLDSYNGFTKAANLIEDTTLQHHFAGVAQERIRQAVGLQQLIDSDDEQPLIEGSIAGRIHRAIMDWKDTFSEGPNAVLTEVKRGEDYIKAKYEAVLSRTAGSKAAGLLKRQYAAVQQARNRICELRTKFTAT
ncbi:hypothetical protein Mal52_46740 [Symmachiella dynata]|uniref:DUF2383 domain-containing protein n=1 Tax=Symmachiella dynata TaxID=2527995 RepID=A0A517ZUQ6_9PLAN|nr:PA2169 family four-helix-bundle protein [Symmachiella dynata]QDU46175.1 hypothetical protein Mal52_46740 [Symmachiella dynata]